MTTSPTEDPSCPLEGLRVLDVGTMTPGKYCTLLLADLGAEVTRVERPPSRPKRIDEEDLVLNRNKRSITLNLRTEEGREILYRLTQEADVLLESHRPGVAARMGLDYPTLREKNPRIVCCSLSGFGQNGPYAPFPAFDLVLVAMGGLLHLLGGRGRPPIVPGLYIADAASGLMATIGILAALWARMKTGRGQHVDIGMLDSVLSVLSLVSGGLRRSGEPFQAEALDMRNPGYHVYEAGDGRYLALGIFRPSSWEALCRIVGRDDFIEHQWATGEKQEEIFAFFREVFRTKPRDQWCQELRERDIETGPVHEPKEIYEDPQVLHRGMVVEVDHPVAGKTKQIGNPLKLSGRPIRIRKAAPWIGEDTEAVLRQMGYGEEGIERLRRLQVI